MDKDIKELLDAHQEAVLEYVASLKTKSKKPKTVMDLKYGDAYYVIYRDGDINYFSWDNTQHDKEIRSQGHLFLTREEAERESKRRELTFKLSQMDGARDFVAGVRNWHICWGLSYYRVCVDDHTWIQANKIYFETKEDAEAAASQFTTEELKIICGVKS